MLLAILFGLGHQVRAAPPPVPVCARNEVLDIVADDVARRGIAATIVPGSIGQVPTARPSTVRCAVRLQTTYYDTDRYGVVPQVRLTTVEYSVRAGRNGLFVEDLGPPR